MAEIDLSQQVDLGGTVRNAFGEHSLFAINRHVFKDTDAGTVFRSYFSDTLFKEDSFYIIAGTDSGLLYQYVNTRGVPKGSRYLFVELPQVLALLEGLEPQPQDLSQTGLVVATEENWRELARAMGAISYAFQDSFFLIRSLGTVHGHYSGYHPFWRKIKKEYDDIIWEQQVRLGTRPFFLSQIENLTENQVPALHLKGTFTGKTAVILAGGPSLDDLLPWVREHRQNLLVIAASRTSGILLQAGIQPDISVSIDPFPINLHISRNVLDFQDGTLLVNEYYVTPNLLSSWGGQKVFIGPRYPWITPNQPDNLAPTSGTTVTNSAFGLAVEMGAGQIILGGVDFCFSQEGYTHASNTVEYARGPRAQLSEQQVETNSGMIADTLYAYVRSAQALDQLAQNAMAGGCRTINPAAGAMRLPHIEHIPVDGIDIVPMECNAREILNGCIPPSNNSTRTKLYKEVLNEINRVLKELASVKELSTKALVYNRKLFARDEPDAGIHNKEKVERIEARLNEKYASTSSFIRAFGVTRFTAGLRLNEDRYVEDLEKGCRLYHRAFVDTCTELIDILRLARTRTMSRLEEEKTQPDIKRLLEQWRQDQQPGRAIQWERHHKNAIGQLSITQQQDVLDLQDSFEKTVDELGKDYTAINKHVVKMDIVASKAEEYFQSHEQARLSRLLTGLQGQHDQNHASHFISLVQGYLAELCDKPMVAIDAYQHIADGPAQEKALRRLFELYTHTQDYSSALDTLKTLSGIDLIYSPMYADMLHATGDIDKAVEIYTDYLLANPGDLNTMMKLGNIFLQCDSVEGVVWTMNYILDKDPDNQAAQRILKEVGIPNAAGIS